MDAILHPPSPGKTLALGLHLTKQVKHYPGQPSTSVYLGRHMQEGHCPLYPLQTLRSGQGGTDTRGANQRCPQRSKFHKLSLEDSSLPLPLLFSSRLPKRDGFILLPAPTRTIFWCASTAGGQAQGGQMQAWCVSESRACNCPEPPETLIVRYLWAPLCPRKGTTACFHLGPCRGGEKETFSLPGRSRKRHQLWLE